VYDVPGFTGARAGTEVLRAFYMLYRVDERFTDLDEYGQYFTAFAVGSSVHFKVPAWPFPLHPSPLNKNLDAFWRQLTSQVPDTVAKQMTHVHSIFESHSEDAGVDARRWKTIILDFSRVKGVDHLSSEAVFADAKSNQPPDREPKDMLDYHYIEVAIDPDDNGKGNDVFLGFYVGVIPPEGGAARKVQRTTASKSKLAQKKHAAQAAKAAWARQSGGV
jgi:hypothetical protein